MKKICSILLALALLLGASACGGGKSDDPNLGIYHCSAVELMGISMAPEDLMKGQTSLELKAGGKGTAMMDGAKASLKWELDGTALSFTFEGETFTGILQNGEIRAEMMGMTMTFVNADYTPAAGGAEAAAGGGGGYFRLESGTEDGEIISGDELRALGLEYYVILNEDGTLVFQLDNTLTGTWKDGVMHASNEEGDTEDLPYTLNGDELTVDLDGLIMVFLRSNEEPPAPAAASAQNLNALQQWWPGQWYGYWEVSGATDGYAHLEEGPRNCYAEIEMAEDGVGIVYLWEDSGGLASVDILATEAGGAGKMGAATSEGGTFLEYPIGHADWIIDPSLYGYEDYMVIDGSFENPDYPGEGFFYWVYLRPWGMLWDDIEEDGRPPNYEDWYLGLYTQRDMFNALDGIMDEDAPAGEAGADTGAGNSGASSGQPDIDLTIDPDDINFGWGAGEKGIDGWVMTKDGSLKMQVPQGWEKAVDLGNEEISVRNAAQFDYYMAVRIKEYFQSLAKRGLAHTPENQAKMNAEDAKLIKEKWGNTDVWYRIEDVEGRDTAYVFGFAAYSDTHYLGFDINVKREGGTIQEFMKSDAWKTLTTTFELTLP